MQSYTSNGSFSTWTILKRRLVKEKAFEWGLKAWIERLGKPTYTISVYHSRLDISIERFTLW